MNKYQKEVVKSQLELEQKTIDELIRLYENSRKECYVKISELSLRTDLQNIESIIYQKKYQRAILKQIDKTLNVLHKSEFETVEEFLEQSYVNGWVGMYYELHRVDKIPLIVPVDQNQVIKAIQLDSKLKDPLYRAFGNDIERLKKDVCMEVANGIVQGLSWNEVGKRLSNKIIDPFGKSLNRAIRIARTESHRVCEDSRFMAQIEAKNKGCDIVKMWNATLDDRTRESHQVLDGQIREINEPYELNGNKAMFPGGFGIAEEDINCRCVSLQRAKWNLDKDELKTLQDRSSYFGLDKSKSFDDFKKIYLNATEKLANIKETNVLKVPLKESSDEHYDNLLKLLDRSEIDYNPVKQRLVELSDQDIIQTLSGGDLTSGSCASVGLAYIGQKLGYDVRDFRGGKSLDVFSDSLNLYELSKAKGIKALHYGDVPGKTSVTLAKNLLNTCEEGKEYYLSVGTHVSIVRKTKEGNFQFLELQSVDESGWTNFNENVKYTLHKRFGCSSLSYQGEWFDFMINITDSFFNNDEFKSVLGYINTNINEERKGDYGSIK